MATILSGSAVAAALSESLIQRTNALKEKGVTPTLAIVRVGAREDDLSYERGAMKRCEKIGVAVKNFVLDAQATQEELLAQNAQHKDWCCTEELMKTTRDGKALYLHCLPADINGVSCVDGEVEASVFDRYRDPLYKEASFKPYVIAAMIFLAKVKDPQATLKALEDRGAPRWFQK